MPPKRPRPLQESVAVSLRVGLRCQPAPAELDPDMTPGEVSDTAMAMAVIRKDWVGEIVRSVSKLPGSERIVEKVSPCAVFFPSLISSILGVDGPTASRSAADLELLAANGDILLCASPVPKPNDVVAVSASEFRLFCHSKAASLTCDGPLRAGLSVVLKALDMQTVGGALGRPPTCRARAHELSGSALDAARKSLQADALSARAARTAHGSDGATVEKGSRVGPVASGTTMLPPTLLPPLEALLGPLLQLGVLVQQSLPGSRTGGGAGAPAMRNCLDGALPGMHSLGSYSPAAAAVASTFALGVPSAGRLWEYVTAGRRELLQRLARQRHGDMSLASALKLRLARTPLPPLFHIRDAVGAGLAAEVQTADGKFLRILPAGAISLGSPRPRPGSRGAAGRS